MFYGTKVCEEIGPLGREFLAEMIYLTVEYPCISPASLLAFIAL
jgi:hypothetical protein